MKLFSERTGINVVGDLLIIDDVTDQLRSGLWNALDLYYFQMGGDPYSSMKFGNADRLIFIKRLWHHHFKGTLDSLPDRWFDVRNIIRDFFFKCAWYEVYDFIEFLMQSHPGFGKDEKVKIAFIEFCNDVLERESIGYRIVDNCFVKITSEDELNELKVSLKSPFKSMAIHFSTALTLLSDKKNPDFRNSIKESISAVESTCNELLGGANKSLGDALTELEKKKIFTFHGAEKRAYQALYGYTSDANGIRHSLLEGDSALSYDDAKFMLVSCSAFCNYLISKSKG